jgi:DinB superfamily
MPAMNAAAEQLRSVPARVKSVLDADGVDDDRLRRRPAMGEWSAVEVVGHLVDKMQFWSERVERILHEEQPYLRGYDQDVYVRERQYQSAQLSIVLEHLREGCEHFATLLEALPQSALARQGVHQEMGPISLEQCISIPLASVEEHLNQMRAAIRASGASQASARTD